MQVQFYSTGGFVVHRITGDFKGKASAYFNNRGKLTAADQIQPGGKVVSVRQGKSLWLELHSLGRRAAIAERATAPSIKLSDAEADIAERIVNSVNAHHGKEYADFTQPAFVSVCGAHLLKLSTVKSLNEFMLGILVQGAGHVESKRTACNSLIEKIKEGMKA